jgi:hypothetical protein
MSPTAIGDRCSPLPTKLEQRMAIWGMSDGNIL